MTKKYYKLIDNNLYDMNSFLFEFKADKRKVMLNTIKNAPFLLIEKTMINSREKYSNLIAVFCKNDLLKKIENNACFDYTERDLCVWYNQIKYTWEQYKNLKKK